MAKLKLTPKLKDTICEYIKEGNYINTACEAVGISKHAFFMWMKKGEAESEGVYRDFFDSIKKAQADGEMFLLKTIRVKSMEQWTAAAWILERKYPEKWGRREYIKIVEDDVPAESATKVQSLKDALNNMTDKDLENLLESSND